MATKKNSMKVKRTGGPISRPLNSAERQFVESLGARVKQLRSERDITAQALSEAVGIKTVGQFNREAGRAVMPVVDLYRYAVALGIPAADLLPVEASQKSRQKAKAPESRSSDAKGGQRADIGVDANRSASIRNVLLCFGR